MKPLPQLFTKALQVGTLLIGFATSLAKAGDIIPQAQPIVKLLKAVKEGDQEQLKPAFSERMRAKFDKEGWDKALQAYQKYFKEEFGDYKLEDFAFDYKEQGGVSIVYKGKTLRGGMSVLLEKDVWKINER